MPASTKSAQSAKKNAKPSKTAKPATATKSPKATKAAKAAKPTTKAAKPAASKPAAKLAKVAKAAKAAKAAKTAKAAKPAASKVAKPAKVVSKAAKPAKTGKPAKAVSKTAKPAKTAKVVSKAVKTGKALKPVALKNTKKTGKPQRKGQIQGAKGKLLAILAKRKKNPLRYVIDCSHPVNDGIMDSAAFEKFLHDHIKLNGKTGVLGSTIRIIRDKTKLTISAATTFSKRYLKYLTKKFLKKQQLRDWLRVVASSKNTYELRYFNIHENEDEDEDEDEEETKH
jgi:large subunit ribosomal protein L22e